MEALAVSREYFKHVVVEIWSKIQKRCHHLPQQLFLFSNPKKTSWHLYGRRGVTRGEQFPGRRITTRSAEWRQGRQKVQTMSQVFSSIQYICFLKTSNSNMLVPTLLLAPGAV